MFNDRFVQEEAVGKATVVHFHSKNPGLLQMFLWVALAKLQSLTNKYVGQNNVWCNSQTQCVNNVSKLERAKANT